MRIPMVEQLAELWGGEGEFGGNFGENNAGKLAGIYTLTQTSFYAGLMIGGWSGCRRSSLQFHAEHQHTLPGIKSRPEAAAYLRLRNAHILLGGIREGVRRGMQLGMVAALFGGLKWGVGMGREALAVQRIPIVGHADELLAAMGTGTMFAIGVRGGERMYLLRKGIKLGAALGTLLVALRCLHEAYKDNSHHPTATESLYNAQ